MNTRIVRLMDGCRGRAPWRHVWCGVHAIPQVLWGSESLPISPPTMSPPFVPLSITSPMDSLFSVRASLQASKESSVAWNRAISCEKVATFLTCKLNFLFAASLAPSTPVPWVTYPSIILLRVVPINLAFARIHWCHARRKLLERGLQSATRSRRPYVFLFPRESDTL